MSSSHLQSIPQGKIVLTYDEYCLLPDDRNRYEILDGELSVTPAPRIKHQRASSRLHVLLSGHVMPRQLGEIFPAPTDVILAPTTVVQPDLVFIANDRHHFLTERAIEGPPTLVIEILSPTTSQTDRVTKAQLYARFGVPHYWLLDTDQQTLEAYELAGGEYKLAAKAQGSEIFAPELFPSLTIPLADIWR